MKAKYYEVICRTQSTDFQEWDQLEEGDFTEMLAAAQGAMSGLDKADKLAEAHEGIIFWHDRDSNLLCAVVHMGDIEDYRDLWGPFAYPNSN